MCRNDSPSKGGLGWVLYAGYRVKALVSLSKIDWKLDLLGFGNLASHSR